MLFVFGCQRRGEEGGGGGRRTWLEQAPCVAVPVRTGEKDLEVHGRDLRPSWSCNSLRPLPLPALFFIFLEKPRLVFIAAQKKRLMCTVNMLSLMGATGAVRAERPRPLCAPWSASDGEGPTLGTAVRRNRSNGFGARPGYLRGFFGCTWPARTQVVCACTQRVLAAPALKSLSSSLAGTARKQFGGTPREKCVRLAD